MTFEEFCKKIRETKREDLPKYQEYTLGDCGHQYGKTWRNWEKVEVVKNPNIKERFIEYLPVDQIVNVIKSIKTNPEGRRHLVSSIDPTNSENLALYWCHSLFQFNCRKLTQYERLRTKYSEEDVADIAEKDLMYEAIDGLNLPEYYLDCQMYQRSGDTFLGVPLNIASYALLTHIIAVICNMIPGEFIHTLGDAHIYDNHKEQVDLQLSREPFALPKLKISQNIINDLQKYGLDETLKFIVHTDFTLENYEHCGEIKGELTTGMKK